MTDPIKTDAEKVEADVKSTLAKLKDDEIAAMGWVKIHILWFTAGGCLIAGLVLGKLL